MTADEMTAALDELSALPLNAPQTTSNYIRTLVSSSPD